MRLVTALLASSLLVLVACDQGAGPAPEPAPVAAPTSAPAAASVVPAGVGHVENPAVQDIPTPTDMPDFDAEVAAGAWAKLSADHGTKLAAACGADGAAIVRLVPNDDLRIGYVSYKNRELPVSGLFEKAVGYADLGANRHFHLAIDPLSLESGDEVRTRKLNKLFFEFEDVANAAFTFAGTEIDGDLPQTEGESSEITLSGDLTLHGASNAVSVAFDVTRQGEGWAVELAAGENLLALAGYGLLDPLNALIASCNHSAMGDAIKLDLSFHLVSGCS